MLLFVVALWRFSGLSDLPCHRVISFGCFFDILCRQITAFSRLIRSPHRCGSALPTELRRSFRFFCRPATRASRSFFIYLPECQPFYNTFYHTFRRFSTEKWRFNKKYLRVHGILGKISKTGGVRDIQNRLQSPESSRQCTAIFAMLYIRIIYELSEIYRKNTAIFKPLIIVFFGFKNFKFVLITRKISQK